MDIETIRMAFAEELRFVAHVRSDKVIQAFATVPRERFLGDRPWQVADLAGDGGYWTVPGDDAGAAYHNVLFAIDADRGLNNGHPEFWPGCSTGSTFGRATASTTSVPAPAITQRSSRRWPGRRVPSSRRRSIPPSLNARETIWRR